MSGLKRRIERIEERIGTTSEPPSSEEYIREWLDADERKREVMKTPVPRRASQLIRCNAGEAIIAPAVAGCLEFRAIIDDIREGEASRREP